jgi:apolipoprotein N-acyltransferase
MATFRAVEQGVNLVRHTSHGLSLAVDYQGRVLGAMDHYAASDRDFVVQVPTRGVRTIYARVGDLFAWMCTAGLAFLAILPFARHRSSTLG